MDMVIVMIKRWSSRPLRSVHPGWHLHRHRLRRPSVVPIHNRAAQTLPKTKELQQIARGGNGPKSLELVTSAVAKR